MDSPVFTHPCHELAAEGSIGRRYAMSLWTALTIPPGDSRIPKGIVGPGTARYGVRLEYRALDMVGKYDIESSAEAWDHLASSPGEDDQLFLSSRFSHRNRCERRLFLRR